MTPALWLGLAMCFQTVPVRCWDELAAWQLLSQEKREDREQQHQLHGQAGVNTQPLTSRHTVHHPHDGKSGRHALPSRYSPQLLLPKEMLLPACSPLSSLSLSLLRCIIRNAVVSMYPTGVFGLRLIDLFLPSPMRGPRGLGLPGIALRVCVL